MKVKVSFDAGAAEERQRSFREATSKWAIGVTPDAPPEPGEEGGRIEAHVAGPFVLARAQAHTSAVRRTRADVASDTTLRFRLTRTPVDAWQRVGLTPTRDAEYHHSAGDFVISTNEWTFDSAARSGKSGAEMLVIPHHLLAPLLEGGRLTGPVVVPARSSVGALLTAGFFAAFKEVPLLPPDLGGAVLQNFCGLVALACGASDAGRDSGPRSVREMRLVAARRHVSEHLADSALGPAHAAAALGISVRQLHLVFEPTGESFNQYVLRRRLEACRAALASPAEAGRSIVDIAFGWGFDSLSTFYRTFHRAFGIAPGDLPASAQPGDV